MYHSAETYVACNLSKRKLGQAFLVFRIHVKCYLIAIKIAYVLEDILSGEIKLASIFK